MSKKYRIIALGWDREANNDLFWYNGKIAVKHLRLKAPYGKIWLVFYYPLFWVWVLINLIIYRPRIVYSCNLDTLIPSYVFRILFPAKLVFDSFDKYAMAFIPSNYHVIYTFADMLENMLSSKADALITVSKERLATFGRYKPKYSEVIMNCPEDMLGKIQKNLSHLHVNDVFTLVYAGIICYDRGLLLLAHAIREVKGTRLILAGRIMQDIRQLLQNPNIQYIGMLEYSKALELQGMADAIPILYDPKIPINRVANPNKLFEAMMLGVPVITNVCKGIVEETGCGLVVEYNYKSVKKALQYLASHPEVRKKMGANGRKAFEEKYNWNLMEEKLLRLCQRLLNS
ncbi:glycosyltransferase [Candidatus Culexarchaeum yellowstonense]|uniref:glycosyltransferase n=1 Tax=Candidatus Culexarchaeum yellowstonense TaxID=2928963 RepID=UPI0026F0C503|nr:glycosyltransferase [Candidatus Culexarchaeum yellowstonense]